MGITIVLKRIEYLVQNMCLTNGKENKMTAIEKKQEELIKHLSKLLHSYEYEVIDGNSKWLRLESELAALESEQEKKCDNSCKWFKIGYGHCEWCLRNSSLNRDKSKHTSGYGDNYEHKRQPKQGERLSAEEIWPNKVRLYMIEKSKFYEDERIYQYGFYDGYQYASQRLPSDNRKTIEDYLLEKGIITLSGMYDDKIIYQFRNIPYPDEIINIIIDYIKLK